MGALTLGGIVYPIEPPDVGGTLVDVCDPFLAVALPFFQSVINTYLEEAYVAAMAGQATAAAGQRACAETSPIDPGPYLDTRALKLPLLAVYPVEIEGGEYTLQNDRVDTTYRLAFILPMLTWEQAKRVMPMLLAVYGILRAASERGHDADYDSDAAVWDEAGVLTATIRKGSVGFVEAQGAHLPLPTLAADIVVRLKDGWDSTEDVDLTAVRVTEKIGVTPEDTDAPTIVGDVEFEAD